MIDPLLERELDFACGFAIGMTDHQVSNRTSNSCIASVGGVASGLTFADFETGLVASLYMNGSSLHEPGAHAAKRMEIMDQIVLDAQAFQP